MLPLRTLGTENPKFPEKEMKEMTSGCCVCAEENGWTGNPLVYCDGPGCDVAVHQGCYGIIEVPEGEWFCARCLALSSASDMTSIRCELCPYSTGALKRTADSKWTHVTCALYIPEVRFGNVNSMDPIIISDVPSERFSKPCYLCEEDSPSKAKIGACMPCNRPGCRRVFHVTCGQKHGLLCELGNTPQTVNVKYCGYCTTHIKKASQDPAVKIIGSGHQESVSVVQKDLESINISIKPHPIESTDAVETPIIKQPVKRSRMNDVPGADLKAKKPRHSTKSSTNGRSFKSLLKLVGPVVSDTVSDFQRERVAAQHAAAALHGHAIPQSSASTSQPVPTLTTANSNAGLTLTSVSTNGFTNINSNTENSNIPPINGALLSDWDLLPQSTVVGGATKAGKTDVDRNHLMSQTPSTSGLQQFPTTMEELLERQWEQGSAFLMGQAQFDVAQLMNCLNDLKMENSRLQDQMNQLQKRRDHLLALNSRLTQPLSCASAAVSSPHHSPRSSTAQPTTTTSTTSASVTPVITSSTSSAASVVSTAPVSTNASGLYSTSSDVTGGITSLSNSEDSLNRLRSLASGEASPQMRPTISNSSACSTKLLPTHSNLSTAGGRASVMSSPPAPTPVVPIVNGLVTANVPNKLSENSPGQQPTSQSIQSLLNSAGFFPRLPSTSVTVPSATSLPTGSSFTGTQDAFLNPFMFHQQQLICQVLQQQRLQAQDPTNIARLFTSQNTVPGNTPGVVSGLGNSSLVGAPTANSTGTASSASSSLVK